MAISEPHQQVIADVQAVSKVFRQGDRSVHALRDLDLTIHKGTFVAVMGASGSGKSTLLHLLSGLTRPTSGTITIDGQDLSQLSDRKLTHFRRHRIGLVFQAFNLIPSLNAYDNILFPLYVSGAKQPNAAVVNQLAEQLGIGERLSHRPDSLSGGEQQRVALARAFITDPAIVFADEPTGSLDSVTRLAICERLRELCDQQQRTIVVVTHEPSVAIWADEVVVLKDGRVVTQCPARDFSDASSLASYYQQVVGESEMTLA